jgi:hypothetical protein
MVQMSVARLGLVFLASQNFLPYLSLIRRAPYDYDNYYNLYFAIVIIVDCLSAVMAQWYNSGFVMPRLWVRVNCDCPSQ